MARKKTKSAPAKGHVFIVTYGRSGSTLLQNLLNTIPGYQIRGENNNALLPLYEGWKAIKTAAPLIGMRKSGAPSDQSHPWFGGELVDPDTLGRALAECFSREVLHPDPDKHVIGFKEVRFHAKPKEFAGYLDFIHDYFPNSRFVFNTRDHQAVSRSGWWARRDPKQVRQILTRAEKLYSEYLTAHPDRGIHMHYDDYVADPGQTERLFEFLGEPYDPVMVEQVMDVRLDHARGKRTAQK